MAETLKGTLFKELQDEFLGDAPDDHKDQTTELHERMAKVWSKIAADIVSHIVDNLEQDGTGTVSTSVNTAVTTAGAPTAQTGTGTGSGSGTSTTPPGGFT